METMEKDVESPPHVKILLVNDLKKDKTFCVKLDPKTAEKVINGDISIAEKLWKQVNAFESTKASTKEVLGKEWVVETSALPRIEAHVEEGEAVIETTVVPLPEAIVEPKECVIKTSVSVNSDDHEDLVWTSTSTRELIRLVKAHDTDFNNPKLAKKSVWAVISEELKSFIKATPRQSENKWKNLKRRLRTHESQLSATEGSAKNWEFYHDMVWVTGQDPIQPKNNVLVNESTEMEVELSTTVEASDDQVESTHLLISTDDSTSSELVWSRAATYKLINLRVQHDDKFRNPKVIKKKIWSIICQQLQSFFSKDISYVQAENKWKNLKRRFKTIEEFNPDLDRPKKPWRYYNEMAEALRSTNDVSNDASSSDMVNNSSDNSDDTFEIITDVYSNMEPETVDHKARKRKAEAKFDEVIKLLKDIKEHQIDVHIKNMEEAEKKRKLMEKIHEEKMEVLRSFVHALHSLNK